MIVAKVTAIQIIDHSHMLILFIVKSCAVCCDFLKDLLRRHSWIEAMKQVRPPGKTVRHGRAREIPVAALEQTATNLLEIQTVHPETLSAIFEKLTQVNRQRCIGLILSRSSTISRAGTPLGVVVTTDLEGTFRVISVQCTGTF